MNDDSQIFALYSLESERAVIASLLLDNNAFDRISDVLAPEMFFDRQNQMIAKVVFSELAQGKPCDVFILEDLLAQRDELETVGGLSYLADLVQNQPSAANIRRYADIVAGRYVARGAIHVASEMIENLQTTKGVPAAELVSRAAGTLESLTEDRAAEDMTLDACDLGLATIANIDRRRDMDPDTFDGLATGLRDLDKVLRGLKGGDLVIIAGRPAMGKTVLAMNIAEHAGRFAGPAIVFSMEMSKDQLGDRQAASLTGIPLDRIQSGDLDGMDWDAMSNYARIIKNELRMFIDFRPALSVGQVRSKCRQLTRKHGKPAVIVVDYLQLMRADKAENRNQEISQITAGLKALAKDFSCPVIALSQLSRDVEKRADKRPLMSDLRDSGAIEQDADVILFPYRDEYYNPDSPDKGTVELLMGKFRQGEPKPVRLMWQGECARMRNLDHSWTPAPNLTKKSHNRGGFDG
jgi:replicative DNA helicase